MFMPGALLVGCDAGTLNMPKIKGSHRNEEWNDCSRNYNRTH